MDFTLSAFNVFSYFVYENPHEILLTSIFAMIAWALAQNTSM